MRLAHALQVIVDGVLVSRESGEPRLMEWFANAPGLGQKRGRLASGKAETRFIRLLSGGRGGRGGVGGNFGAGNDNMVPVPVAGSSVEPVCGAD